MDQISKNNWVMDLFLQFGGCCNFEGFPCEELAALAHQQNTASKFAIAAAALPVPAPILN